MAYPVYREQGLQHAVFAYIAVQGQKRHVRARADLHHMLADRPRARIPQSLQVRLAVRHVAAAWLLCLRRIRGVKIPLPCAEAQVEQQRPVSAPRERAGNQRAGGEGYVPFRAEPARQYHDFH